MKRTKRTWITTAAFVASAFLLLVIVVEFRSSRTGVSTGHPAHAADSKRIRERPHHPQAPDAARESSHARGTRPPDMDALRQRLAGLPAEDAIRLLQSLAKTNRAAAFELAVELAAEGDPAGTAREVLRLLACDDVEGAMAWGESRNASPDMEVFWAALTDLSAGPNPRLAFEAARKTSGALRLRLLEDVFSEWAGEDIHAAKRAAAAITDPGDRLAIHLAILPSEIERDPAQAVAWIESIADPVLQDTLYYHAVRSWTDIDPASASAFVSSQAESDYKAHVAGSVVESWVRQDSSAAFAWASGLPEQEARQQAISAGLSVLMETSAQQAADMALQLPVHSDRAAALESIISEWITRDRAALELWVAKIPDPALRDNLQQMTQDHLRHEP